MADDPIVVEVNASVALRNLRGEPTSVSGVVLIERELIAPALAALPERRIRVVLRPPSEEEIQRSVQRGFTLGIGVEIPLGGPARDERALTQLRKAELEAVVGALSLGASGTRAELLGAIDAEAERLEVSTTGPWQGVVNRIQTAQGERP
jgi:hypothetical protein